MFASLLIVCFIAGGAMARVWAQSSRVGVVTTLDGVATLTRGPLPQGVPLKLRDDVLVADRIVTGDRSFARILFGGKAIITIRERSVLTITEGPGMSVVDVGVGGVSVAVVKERMQSGESVELRTPNAVVAMHGTVVIAEVSETAAPVTTTITVLRGTVEFRHRDGLTRQPVGKVVTLGALQSVRVTGFSAPRQVQGVPDDMLQQLLNDFRVPLRIPPAVGSVQPLPKAH